MLNPLTNFDAWMNSAMVAINDPVKLEIYYSTFEGFLSSISQTGFLPDPLVFRTGAFIDKLNNQFCKSIINKVENDDIKLPIMRQYLDLFLKFSLYGIKSYDKSAINFAIIILGNPDHPFYQATTRHSIYKSLCKKYVEYGAMKFINEKLSDPIQNLELFQTLITLVSALHMYDQDYDPGDFTKTTSQLLYQYIIKNQSSLNVESFSKCIEELRNALPKKYDIIELFISEFLPLLTCFFSSNNFEQRLAAVKEVSRLSKDNIFHKQISAYFEQNIDLIENLQFRSEYAECIGDIIAVIASFEGCTTNTVVKIWDKRTYLHASELKSFYEMFLQFANFGKGQILHIALRLLFSLEYSNEWFDLLDTVLMNIKDRKDCADFLNQIRFFLMQIIFPDLPKANYIEYKNNIGITVDNSTISSEIVGRAKSSLLLMVTFAANEFVFLQLVSLLSENNNNFVLHLLSNFFNDDIKIKISQEVIHQTLEKSLDLLVVSSLHSEDTNSNGPSEEIKNFILKLCKFNNEPLTFQQLEKIFSCYKVIHSKDENQLENLNGTDDIYELKTLNAHSNFPNFFKFLDSLVTEEAITPDHLQFLLNRFQSNDKSFFKLIKHLIYEANDSNPLAAKVTHLPLNKQDLLWTFALTDSPQRLEFDKLLCQIYASNDGEELSDKDVIDAFLDQWQLYYNHQVSLEQNPQFGYNVNHSNLLLQINPNYVSQANQASGESPEGINLNVSTSLPILVDILRLFIFTMECQSSSNFNYAHRYEPEKIDVTVYWTDSSNIMHFVVPPSTTIGSIIESISNEKNIKISTPILKVHNSSASNFEKPLKRTQSIGMYAEEQMNGKKEVMFDIKYEKGRKIKLHKRTARVSSEVINSPYIDGIFSYLLFEKNDQSSYNLFKLLPPYKKAPDFKTINIEDPNLELRALFPFDHLCYFLYNFISLLIDSSEELSIATKMIQYHQFDLYLIDAIEFFIIDKEFRDLGELSLDLVKYFLDFFILVPPLQQDESKNENFAETRQRLFIVLIKLSLNPSLFKMVNKVCDFQFARKSQQIRFPDNFEDIFKTLILNEEKKIRDFAVNQFKKVNIPFSVFTDCLVEMGDSVSGEFLTSMTSHLNDEIINEPTFCQTILKLLYSDSAHGAFLSKILTLVLNMLQREIIDKSELPDLLHFLINRFINVNYDKNDRIAFETASKCIVLLSSEANFFLKTVLEDLNDRRTKPFHNFHIDGDQIEISRTNKVGLKNLSMTCYLNATLQQFYSIKPFRYAIMNYKGDNDFLKQLAILFQNMKFIKTKSVTTQSFVDHFSLMGEKLDPRRQQDATEFIQSFFDLIQADSYYRSIVDELFKVIIKNSIRGLEKDSFYENDTIEPTYVFELEVKHLHSMKDGFDHFIKPNYLTGQNMYKIAKDQFINAVKYSGLSQIPPFLIIQLMRFEFEFTRDVYQRKKISQHYEILKEIDIAKYTEDKSQEAIYSLTGIIIHKGTALHGHYISLVKSKKNGWLCFDDEVVTEISENEVMQQASGIERTDITGYILFYRREDYFDIPCLDLKNKYVLPEERRIEIDALNEENLQQQLVCSSGYFELMKGLSKLVDSTYLDVCLKYAVNTLPFTKSADESKEIYKSLAQRIKPIQMQINADQFNDSIGNRLILYMVNNGFLSSALFECPSKKVRKGIVKLIKSCFVPSEKLIYDINFSDCVIEFTREVFKLFPNCLFNYLNIDQLFNVLYYIVKKFPVVKKIAETEWNEAIQDLFVNGITSFFASRPNWSSNYVYRGMNLTHFLKFVCNISLTNINQNGKIFSDDFYFNALISNTKPMSLSLFTDMYFSRDLFISLIHSQELINEDNFKVFSLMFHIVPEQAVHLAMTCDFKKASFACKSEDIITYMAVVTALHQDTIPDIVVKYCTEWMPPFFTDDNYVTRNNAVVCALYTIPCQTITKGSLLDLDMPEYISIPVEMDVKTRPIDEKIINRAKFLFKCLLESVAPTLTAVIRENSKSKQKGKNQHPDNSPILNRACQFFQLMNEILLIIPSSDLNGVQWNSIIDLYAEICKTDNQLFSEQVSTALSVINNFNIPLNIAGLMLSLGINLITESSKKTASKTKNYSNLHNFLPHFLSILRTRFSNINLPEDFVYFFFENIAFAPIGKVSKCFEDIKSYVKDLCRLMPGTVNEILQSKKIKKWETNNICMIIAICTFLNKKRILIPIVAQTFKEIVKAGIDINEIVLQAIDRSMKNAYNEQVIEQLCDESKLSSKVKDALRNLLL